jgi:hypothetical protein
VRAAFDDASTLNVKYSVGSPDSGKTVGDYQRRSARKKPVQRLLD